MNGDSTMYSFVKLQVKLTETKIYKQYFDLKCKFPEILSSNECLDIWIWLHKARACICHQFMLLLVWSFNSIRVITRSAIKHFFFSFLYCRITFKTNTSKYVNQTKTKQKHAYSSMYLQK